MSLNLTEDQKMKNLASRVGDDVSHLKRDIASLFSHTSRHTIPASARELRAQARDRIHAGGDYAISYLRENPGRSSVGILGGFLLLAAAGTGIFYLCKGRLPCCCGTTGCSKNEKDGEIIAYQD